MYICYWFLSILPLMCRNVFWCCYLFIDMINIIALHEFSSLNGFNWKPKHFNVLPAVLSAKLKGITCTINDVDMWYILPLRSSILGSVVTNCCYKVQPQDLTQLKHLAVSMQWLHCFFGIFSGLLSHITILIFIFAVKKHNFPPPHCQRKLHTAGTH